MQVTVVVVDYFFSLVVLRLHFFTPVSCKIEYQQKIASVIRWKPLKTNNNAKDNDDDDDDEKINAIFKSKLIEDDKRHRHTYLHITHISRGTKTAHTQWMNERERTDWEHRAIKSTEMLYFYQSPTMSFRFSHSKPLSLCVQKKSAIKIIARIVKRLSPNRSARTVEISITHNFVKKNENFRLDSF